MPLPESRDEQFVGTRTIGKQSGASSNAEFASLGRIRLLAFVAGVVFVALTLLVQVLPDGSGAQPITGSLLGSLSLALALVSALVWLWARFSTGARSWPIADFYVICASLAMSLVEVAVFDIGATHLQGIPGLCI